MKKVNVYTIRELLMTPAMQYNQTTLSKFLHITRATVKKFKDDTTNTRHSVLFIGGHYIFMSKTSPNIKQRV